jgi:asparagine synthase (glutamine-hydrolysing)
VADDPETPSEARPWESELTRAIGSALERLPAGSPPSVLFSGGLDSGLLAWELREDPTLLLSTIGLEGSPDLAAAESAARALGLAWSPHIVTASEVLSAAQRIESETRDLGPTARAVDVAFSLAIECAPPGVVLCGQGADELFFGYAHFRGLEPPVAQQRADSDLEYLLTEAWPRARRIAAAAGRQVEAPYLASEFVQAAQAIPLPERLAGPSPKQALRNYARRRGLPDSIALRPKRALQYGTGIDRLLRRESARPDRTT